MKHKILNSIAILVAIFGITTFVLSSKATATSAPEVGKMAPNFTAVDTKGVSHQLSDFKGKNVVLEWSNHDCPFVVKHYGSNNMQKLQKEITDTGTIWLTIVSSAVGKQGHVSADEANKIMEDVGAHSTARILDPSGDIGRLYDAKTTPHMFVIDKNGILAYAGAIDSNSSFSPDTIPDATNYVRKAVNSLNAGEPVKTPSTNPYGCGVKY